MGDGDGWVICAAGHRHWGRHGAAGLLLTTPGRVVLQRRSIHSHEGGTWALPGGARDSHEDVVQTALREAREEAGILAAQVRPYGLVTVDHGGWGYTTLVAGAVGDVEPFAANWESDEVRWWDTDAVAALPLHAGFAGSWATLREPAGALTLVVDAANVVGARPDGWWRDRRAAADRLRGRLLRLVRHGLPVDGLPVPATSGITTVLPQARLVVEGAARGLPPLPAAPDWWQPALSVVEAPGAGDDTIVAEALAAAAASDVVVVTADRGLRDRLPATIGTVGPRWLLDRLDAVAPA